MLNFKNMKNYSVSKVKQLIDLNGDSVNFEIGFTVASKNGEPFDIIVVDQENLDNTPDLKYKHVSNGSISGRFRYDKNVYQNHFLILKAENPCECQVDIQKTELPLQPPTEPQKTPPQQSAPPQPNEQYEKPQIIEKFKKEKDGFQWIKIILVLGFIVAVCFILYWLSCKKEKQPDLYTPPLQKFKISHPRTPQILESIPQPLPPPPLLSEKILPQVALVTPQVVPRNNNSSGLIEKLKGLNINQ
jgi:hypothetical protein